MEQELDEPPRKSELETTEIRFFKVQTGTSPTSKFNKFELDNQTKIPSNSEFDATSTLHKGSCYSTAERDGVRMAGAAGAAGGGPADDPWLQIFANFKMKMQKSN